MIGEYQSYTFYHVAHPVEKGKMLKKISSRKTFECRKLINKMPLGVPLVTFLTTKRYMEMRIPKEGLVSINKHTSKYANMPNGYV